MNTVTSTQGGLESITEVAVYGLAGNGTIFYQNVGSLSTNIEFFNILNPINVTISYEQNVYNYEATVCLNYYEFVYPISGVNLEVTCPAGALGKVSNMTSYLPTSQSTLKHYNKKSSIFMQEKLFNSNSLPSGTTLETITAQVYVKPSNRGGFIVTIPDSVDEISFVVYYSGLQCKQGYPYDGKSCQEIQQISFSSPQTVTLSSGAWQYYQIELDHTNNIVNVSMNGTKQNLELYIQSGYYPTRDWYLPQTVISDKQQDNFTSIIFTPAMVEETEKYFFGIYNADKDTQTASISISYETCPVNKFGYQCNHDITISDNPITGFYVLNGCLPDSDPNTSNNGTALVFPFSNDDSDDSDVTYSEYDYAYFSLSSYPKNYSPLPYYIRISVASNDVSKPAPNFYAKKGGAASVQSNHYNSSTSAVTHQILIRINQEDLNQQYNGLTITDTWFFAVQLPADFSIWVGVNCADNCNGNEHGTCYCGDVTCDSLTNNGTSNFEVFYQRSTSLSDSEGACVCDDPDYDYSPTCSAKNNGHATLYISIISILALLVVVVAILIPVARFFMHRRKVQYTQEYHPIN